MLWFKMVDGVVLAVSENIRSMEDWRHWINRMSIRSFEHATEIAADANNLGMGEFIPVDQGVHFSPRWDVVKMFVEGEAVSYSFNGDSYSDGFIVTISKGLNKITTSTGNVYRRRKNTSAWVQKGGTWHLVHGTRNERNPSF